MICRYCRRSSAGIASSSSSRSANPPREVMGVLNSWEKLLMKSFRRISVPSSSSAAVLNATANSLSSRGRIQPLQLIRTVKSPAANCFIARTIESTGFRITMRIITTILMPIRIAATYTTIAILAGVTKRIQSNHPSAEPNPITAAVLTSTNAMIRNRFMVSRKVRLIV